MTTERLFGRICQIAYVTADIDRGARSWHLRNGLAPWWIHRGVVLEGVQGDAASTVTLNVGLAYLGDLQIELIEPVGPGRTIYHRPDGSIAEGMHHLGWFVDQRDEMLAKAIAAGFRPIFVGENAFSKVAYMTNPDEPGTIFELIEGRFVRSMFDKGIEATKAWDGLDPYRQ